MTDRLRTIIEDHFEFVSRAVGGLGVPSAQIDDVVQQVFIIAGKKLDAIAVGKETAFLFGTARGVAANVRRRQAARCEHIDEDAVEAALDTAPDPEEALAYKETLRTSSVELRDVLVLYEQGLTRAMIASTLEIPLGTVASRLRRARESVIRRRP